MDLTNAEETETKPKSKMGRPATGRKLFGTGVTLPLELKAALVLEAKTKEKSFAALVRSILREHVSRKRNNY